MPSTSPRSTRRSARSTRPTAPSASASGASYTTDQGIKIAGGVEYRWLGDSDIQGPFASAEFRDNDALGVGISITAPF